MSQTSADSTVRILSWFTVRCLPVKIWNYQSRRLSSVLISNLNFILTDRHRTEIRTESGQRCPPTSGMSIENARSILFMIQNRLSKTSDSVLDKVKHSLSNINFDSAKIWSWQLLKFHNGSSTLETVKTLSSPIRCFNEDKK